jgi:hypothetical protein
MDWWIGWLRWKEEEEDAAAAAAAIGEEEGKEEEGENSGCFDWLLGLLRGPCFYLFINSFVAFFSLRKFQEERKKTRVLPAPGKASSPNFYFELSKKKKRISISNHIAIFFQKFRYRPSVWMWVQFT